MRVIAFAILGLFLAISFASVETANAILVTTKDSVVRYFDWLFVAVATGSLLFVVVLGSTPRANVRLGGPESQPDFSRFSWFSMLFSAGLASGLLYWAAAEPIIHFQGNPLLVQSGLEASSEGAMRSALLITIFHWGLHGWGMYVMGALAISVYAYRVSFIQWDLGTGAAVSLLVAFFSILIAAAFYMALCGVQRARALTAQDAVIRLRGHDPAWRDVFPLFGMNARCEQTFIGIDVANSGDHRLIEQCGLDRSACTYKAFLQHLALEVQRIRSQLRPALAAKFINRIKAPDPPESSWITKNQAALSQRPLK